MHGSRWTTTDFPALSWHDNHVHGLAVHEGPDGTGELVLGLDFILEWLPGTDSFSFRVAPATLVFHDVWDLSVSVSYGRVGAAIAPFSIDGISQETIILPTGHHTYSWRIVVNWPEGHISFRASGFTQTLNAAPSMSQHQYLTRQQRGPASGV